jgi:serine/threonine-protein kinase
LKEFIMSERSNPEPTLALDAPGDALDAGLAVAFGPEGFPPPGTSVLVTLAETLGIAPRVLLRESQPDHTLPVAPRTADPLPFIGPSSRYQFFGEIARGGVGAILRGRDLDLGRDLAVKVLLEAHQDNPDLVKRFVEEAQIGGQLQHPGIVPVHELGRFPDQRPYFTMKLVKGRTLAALLEARPGPAHDLPRFLKIFEQVCQTMGYAHSKGVIHRDLKPANIMVGDFGEVQVMDWGLAKVLAEGEGGERRAGPVRPQDSAIRTVRSDLPGSASQAGSVLGTPGYMAPEQARAEAEQLDERCDVFGLGAILCEILTGQPPYVGTKSWDIYRQAMQGDLANALARLDGCGADEELLGLSRRCLAVEPGERPRDAGVVAREMTAYLAGVQERLRAAELERAAAQARAREERKARRLTLALAAAVLALVLLGAGGWLWLDRRQAAEEAEKAARQAAVSAAVNEALQEAMLLRGQARESADMDKWAEALAAVRRAEALLAGDPDDDTERRARAAAKELTAEERAAREAAAREAQDRRMVARLEEIRLRQSEVKDGWFDLAGADKDYAEAFRTYGIDVEKLEPAEAANRIRARAVHVELATALDDWAMLRRTLNRKQDEGWKRLFAVARAADPDPWRDRLRAALAGGDRQALKKLAASADVAALPPVTLVVLANALDRQGEVEAAVALLRQAQRRHPGDFWINRQLGACLSELHPPRWDEAVRYFTAALALRPRSAGAHFDLGYALSESRAWDEAVAVFREAVRLQPDFAEAHNQLGKTLTTRRQYDEAIACFRQTIRLKPDAAHAHANLGSALSETGRYDEAVAAFRQALRLRPDYASGYYNLSLTLSSMGRWDEAIEAARQAVRLQPDYAEALCTLGHALQKKQRFAEGLAALRRGHELGSQRRWHFPSGKWVKEAERLVELDAKLPGVLRGEVKPAGTIEQLELALLCGQYKQLHATAARLFAEAFADAGLADDLKSGNRFVAACSAALAGCGRGEDAAKLDDKERARLRRQALDWLRADLAGWAKRLEGDTPQVRTEVRERLQKMHSNPDLAVVRDEAALAKLPEAERDAWRKLWAEAAALGDRAGGKK